MIGVVGLVGVLVLVGVVGIIRVVGPVYNQTQKSVQTGTFTHKNTKHTKHIHTLSSQYTHEAYNTQHTYTHRPISTPNACVCVPVESELNAPTNLKND